MKAYFKIIELHPFYPVCHIKREKQNRVFEGFAAKAKSTLGWLVV
jgi:hypothetical protein